MRWQIQLGGAVLLAVGLVWLVHSSGEQPIRVFVEPTYEQDRLQKLLALYPDVTVVAGSGSEDVTLRVEGVTDPEWGRTPRAAIRARQRQSGYEVHALAEFLPVRNGKGGRAQWMSSYSNPLHVDDVADILYQVVREAAREEHREHYRPPAEIHRAMRDAEPAS